MGFIKRVLESLSERRERRETERRLTRMARAADIRRIVETMGQDNGWFNVCPINDLGRYLRVDPKVKSRLSSLHCVRWRQMPDELREWVRARSNEIRAAALNRANELCSDDEAARLLESMASLDGVETL